jgi:hypothetical protein
MRVKRIHVLILCLALFVGGCARKDSSLTGSDQAADVTFKTPEEAVVTSSRQPSLPLQALTTRPGAESVLCCRIKLNCAA